MPTRVYMDRHPLHDYEPLRKLVLDWDVETCMEPLLRAANLGYVADEFATLARQLRLEAAPLVAAVVRDLRHRFCPVAYRKHTLIDIFGAVERSEYEQIGPLQLHDGSWAIWRQWLSQKHLFPEPDVLYIVFHAHDTCPPGIAADFSRPARHTMERATRIKSPSYCGRSIKTPWSDQVVVMDVLYSLKVSRSVFHGVRAINTDLRWDWSEIVNLLWIVEREEDGNLKLAPEWQQPSRSIETELPREIELVFGDHQSATGDTYLAVKWRDHDCPTWELEEDVRDWGCW
ncbi:hypothetical protein IF1G_11173 [Cordyceps javanica]|uniref:Chromo domain-containing protein n=1 Tax=Cordyceps javanica TaxID=43265 RepID=A0A545UL42_9HYPO|nr:hypothetical protein IF1G_11173 [Cordyceps javanica]TQW01597.1 hypothetical protein IF2G_10891 [Cordyceps javanica]